MQRLPFRILFAAAALAGSFGPVRAADAPPAQKPSWKPQIFIYQTPKVEQSTSTTFRSVDPQIIQRIITLLEERNLGKAESTETNPSLKMLSFVQTPEATRLEARYTRLGAALSEALGWEQIKNIRVISEQNLKQRLTTVARWDHTPIVRSIALVALGSLHDKNDVVYFQEALWSRNIGIRYAALEAMLNWGAPEAIPVLMDVVKKDESPLIRVTAAGILPRLGSDAGLPLLRSSLEDRDWFVRALAARALGDVGTVEDYELIVNQIDREQNSNTNEFVIAEMCVAALKLFPLKLERDKAEKEARKLKKKGQAVPQPPVAKKPVEKRPDVLVELQPLVVTAPRLKIAPYDPVDPRINFNLLKMLQQKADFNASEIKTESIAFRDLNALITPNGILLKRRYSILGFLLTEGVAGTKDFQFVDVLIRLTKEARSPQVRRYAMLALAYNKDWSHLSIFQEFLRRDDPNNPNEALADHFAAVEALQIWGLNDAKSVLIGVNRLDPSPVVRVYAAQAAARLGDPIGKEYLMTALDDQDWVARAMAMRYYGELGNANDYNKLIGYFGSQQPDIVQAELCTSLLRLYAKKKEREEKEAAQQPVGSPQ